MKQTLGEKIMLHRAVAGLPQLPQYLKSESSENFTGYMLKVTVNFDHPHWFPKKITLGVASDRAEIEKAIIIHQRGIKTSALSSVYEITECVDGSVAETTEVTGAAVIKKELNLDFAIRVYLTVRCLAQKRYEEGERHLHEVCDTDVFPLTREGVMEEIEECQNPIMALSYMVNDIESVLA